MDIETNVVGDITVAKLCATRLDAARAVRFKEGLREISEAGAGHIVLDMTDIDFMDSSGLGAVVTVMKHMGRDKTLELAALRPAVGKVFKLTRMDSVFGIYPSVEDALAQGMKTAI
ncbi:STAS domain-containing protein [Amylibacter sp. IMCC11727]|uniref:STAS domain-containing protein n=1 Tax=Amylibacter sp. IMCC11727 TaxID=3039851 RepID=UPI00244D9BFC|nr:STAS domain-containing protein [Amylibacter sp. IMCC11727]WGI21702.1 STAS domain-containing protein [Amylibacter sp. IMCC11727]